MEKHEMPNIHRIDHSGISSEVTGDATHSDASVIYAGMPNGELWVHRKGANPDERLLRVLPSPIYSWDRQAAVALLHDYLGNEVRAKVIAKDFAKMVHDKLVKPYWILTEREMRICISIVEQINDIRWLPDANCY